MNVTFRIYYYSIEDTYIIINLWGLLKCSIVHRHVKWWADNEIGGHYCACALPYFSIFFYNLLTCDIFIIVYNLVWILCCYWFKRIPWQVNIWQYTTPEKYLMASTSFIYQNHIDFILP